MPEIDSVAIVAAVFFIALSLSLNRSLIVEVAASYLYDIKNTFEKLLSGLNP
jgi:hypothetical protein